MGSIIQYAVTNAVWLIPVLLYALMNIANGLTNHPQVQTWLHVVIDGLSILAKRNAPDQTIKLPFTASKRPGLQIPPPPGGGGGKVAALLLFIGASGAMLAGGAAAVSGCGPTASTAVKAAGDKAKTIGTDIIAQCGKQVATEEAVNALPLLGAVLMNDAAAQMKLAALEIVLGIDAVVCGVRVALVDIKAMLPAHGQPDPRLLEAIKRGDVYLASKAAAAPPFGPPPGGAGK
jgi:hypothetical protein